jgi:hypothetical protein
MNDLIGTRIVEGTLVGFASNVGTLHVGRVMYAGTDTYRIIRLRPQFRTDSSVPVAIEAFLYTHRGPIFQLSPGMEFEYLFSAAIDGTLKDHEIVILGNWLTSKRLDLNLV